MTGQNSRVSGFVLGGRSAAVAILSVLVLILAGCGIGSPETPEGFTEVEVEDFHFAYPEDWHVSTPEDRPPHYAFSAVSGDGGESDYSTAVEMSDRAADDVQGVVDLTVRSLEYSLADLEVTSREEAHVQGAAAAVLVGMTYTTSEGEHLVNFDLYVLRESGAHTLLRVVGRQDSSDVDLMRRIIDTAYID